LRLGHATAWPQCSDAFTDTEHAAGMNGIFQSGDTRPLAAAKDERKCQRMRARLLREKNGAGEDS